jgi:hypothetical protein
MVETSGGVAWSDYPTMPYLTLRALNQMAIERIETRNKSEG